MILVGDLWVALEEGVGPEEQIVKIDRRALGQELLVALVHSQHDLVEVGLPPQTEALCSDKLALGAGDGREDGPGREALGVDLQLLHAALDQVDLVGVVVDGEVSVETDGLALAAQDHGAKGVEGPRGQVLDREAEKLAETQAHLTCGLVGEGQGGDSVRPHSADPHQVGDAVRNDASLAAAGAGDDQQGAVDGLDGFALLGVQSFEDIGCHRLGDYNTGGGAVTLTWLGGWRARPRYPEPAGTAQWRAGWRSMVRRRLARRRRAGLTRL